MTQEQFVNWLTQPQGDFLWVTQVFVIVFLTMVVNFAAKKLFNRVEIQLLKTKNLWDDALLKAARRPAQAFVWLIGLSFAAELTGRVSPSAAFEFISPARQVAVVMLLAWFLSLFIKEAEINLLAPGATREPMDHTTVAAFAKLLRASVFITAALVILQSLGYSVSGVLAFGGIGGIAIGFAAKDLLANFFGGLMVYLDRPFAVGDWIRSPDRSIEGTVEHIGWRTSRIRTFDKRPLYIPNSLFASISVENPSRMSHRRIYETIGIRYEDGALMETIIDKVKEMLTTHEEIDATQTMIVNFNAFAPSSLDFFVYTFTKTTDWIKFHEVKQDVLLKILAIVEGVGAEVAFPTSTIHLVQEFKDRQASEAARAQL
ncbi:MAG: mechanosensitive ion channel family protein [Pseudomonadales bacterium]|nr:mechanosensitive ion channel family protein [Pseudomonadales bacterium]